MKKWGLVILAILFLGVGGFWSYYFYINSYVLYTPIISDGFQLNDVPEANTEEHKKSLKTILDKNGVEWKVKAGKIFIKRKYAFGKEMVSNLTNQVNDTEYVKYTPVVLNHPDEGYENAPGLTVKAENLQAILARYSEKWMVIDGEMYITKRLALDKELVYNYTKKAIDEEFVKQSKELNQKMSRPFSD